MKVRILVIALIVSLGMNVGGILTTSYHLWQKRRVEQAHPGWPRSPSGFLRRRLDLSEEQIDQMHTIRESMFAETLPLREELSGKRRVLMNLLRKAEPDTTDLNLLIAEISHLQAKLELRIFKNIQQSKEVLTPKQQEQFLEFFEQGFHERGMHLGPPRGEFPVKKRQ
jgi:Spy/CpxP family protein refolding chaperone